GSWPSLELLRGLLHPVAAPAAIRAAVESGSPLVDRELIRSGGDTRLDPLPVRPLRVDDRIASYLLGSDVPDARLDGVLAAPPEPQSWEHVLVDRELIETLRGLADWAQTLGGAVGPELVLFFH